MRPVGFIDDDPLLTGRVIHGIKVLGRPGELDRLLESHQIAGVILAGEMNFARDPASISSTELVRLCRGKRVWVRQLRLEFEPLAPGEVLSE